MANQQEKPGRFISLRVQLLVGFTLLFSVVFAVAFFWFYSFASDMALQRIRKDLADTLIAAAEGVDAELMVELAREGTLDTGVYPDDSRYWEHVNWLVTVHNIEPRHLQRAGDYGVAAGAYLRLRRA